MGRCLSQLFGRNFPNYSAGISLSINLRNRAAQADYITDQLNFRQQLIQDKQLHNNIRQGVINSRVALAQSRAAYDTSVEARRLQEQTYAGTRRKYELGTATILDVVITQRDTTARQLAEVQARSAIFTRGSTWRTCSGACCRSTTSISKRRRTGWWRGPRT